jgi:hypothetical protein
LTKNQRRQFYNRLRKAKSKFNWKITDGYIEGYNEDRKKFCPITAIAYDQINTYYHPMEAVELYVDVGMDLDRPDRIVIMDAAENNISKKEITIRKTMLSILNLEEV